MSKHQRVKLAGFNPITKILPVIPAPPDRRTSSPAYARACRHDVALRAAEERSLQFLVVGSRYQPERPKRQANNIIKLQQIPPTTKTCYLHAKLLEALTGLCMALAQPDRVANGASPSLG